MIIAFQKATFVSPSRVSVLLLQLSVRLLHFVDLYVDNPLERVFLETFVGWLSVDFVTGQADVVFFSDPKCRGPTQGEGSYVDLNIEKLRVTVEVSVHRLMGCKYCLLC